MNITEALKNNAGNLAFALFLDATALYFLYQYLETGQIEGRYTFVGVQAQVLLIGIVMGVLVSNYYALKGFILSVKQRGKNV